jgi:diaminopropionate ammonia-lyase
MYLNPSAAAWTYEGTSLDPTIEKFHRELPDYNITPLVSLPDLAQELGVHSVVVKDESSRFGLPAFKILGASWAIRNAVASKYNVKPGSLEELAKVAQAQNVNLVTCTEGNWGRATARMAKYLGIKSTIFVPKHTERATQHLIAREGAEVLPVDGNYDESIRHARQFAEKYGGLLVMDVAWEGYENIPQVFLSFTCLCNYSPGD